MKKKHFEILALVAVASATAYLSLNFNSHEQPVARSAQSITSETTEKSAPPFPAATRPPFREAPAPSVKVEDTSPTPPTVTASTTANTPEESALDFFNNYFSFTFPSVDPSKGKVYAGKRVELSVSNGNGESRTYIPLLQGEYILGIARFDPAPDGSKTFAAMWDVSDRGWTSYPPVDPLRADELFYSKHSMSEYSRAPETYMIFGDIPAYAYVPLNEGGTETGFWVHGLNGEIFDSESAFRHEPDFQHNNTPARLSASGEIELVDEQLAQLPPEEREQWVRETETANEAIRNGLLVLDHNLEVVEDRRH